MLATGLGSCSQERDHYKTLALFVIYRGIGVETDYIHFYKKNGLNALSES